jgi:hypothetical protein
VTFSEASNGQSKNGMLTNLALCRAPIHIYCPEETNAMDINQTPEKPSLGNTLLPLDSQEIPTELWKKMRTSPRNLNSEVKSFPPNYYLFDDKDMPLKKCSLTFEKI